MLVVDRYLIQIDVRIAIVDNGHKSKLPGFCHNFLKCWHIFKIILLALKMRCRSKMIVKTPPQQTHSMRLWGQQIDVLY